MFCVGHNTYMSTYETDNNKNGAGPHPYRQPYDNVSLTVKSLENIFAQCGDFQKREINIGLEGRVRATALWLDGVVDGGSVSNDILRPITEGARLAGAKSPEDCVTLMMESAVYSNTAQRRETAAETLDDICHGWCAVIFDGINTAVTFEVRTGNVRGISEPSLEKSVKGAKDSFVETLRINTSLVRRRICSPKLKLISAVVGRKTLTRCAVMYVDGVADPAVVEELMRRINSIDVDALVAPGYLETYIIDDPRSPFPQVIHTERPDRFSTQLLNGRVGVFADGLSLGFLVPVSLGEFMRVSQDNTNNFAVSTTLSLLRWAALFLSLALPAIFAAIAMYHQEMLPDKLLLSMIQAKQEVPFSIAVEVFTMLLSFDLLQEAGLRLPNPVGDTLSIIGALIVGQSAVEARVVSPIAVIVVALAGICSYALPSQDMAAAIRLIRLGLVALAVFSGLFGVVLGLCLVVWYICSLESYGVNYASPLSDGRRGTLMRAFIRVPRAANKYRDPDLNTPDKRRQR